MKTLISLAALATLGLGAAHADHHKGDDGMKKEGVKVTIENVTPGDGPLLVALQTEDEFPGKAASYTTTAEADAETVTAWIKDVPEGTYAVAVVHDTDGNGDFTIGKTGPTEAWGYAGTGAGKPDFEDASIEVGADGMAKATVTLTYPGM